MQIWIINPFDDLPCEGKAQRFWSLATMLADQGHDVVWWSSDWSHRLKVRREAPERKTDQRSWCGKVGNTSKAGVKRCEKPAGLVYDSEAVEEQPLSDQSVTINFELRLVATPPYRKNISLARIWNHRMFGRKLYRDACAAIDSGALAKPDVILASLPPMEGPIAALRLRARYGCRVITDVMDAWPETLLQALSLGGRAVSGWRLANTVLRQVGSVALWPYARMLRRACRESDAVSAQSETFAAFAKEHGVKGAVHVCYLGGEASADSTNVEPSSHPGLTTEATETEALSAETTELPPDHPSTFLQRSLRLLYLGAMGRSYDLDTILDAVELLNQGGLSVECVFVGDGEKRVQLEAREVAGARFTGFLQGEALARELRAADLGVVPFFSQSGVAIPYKAGDYLAYGLPLLSTIQGELAGLVQRFHCGKTYPVLNSQVLAAAIREYADDVNLLNQAKLGARECFTSKFDRKKIYPAFADWVVSKS